MSTTRTRKRRATRVEKNAITSLGGRRTFNSGAGDEKGDGRVAQRYAEVDGAVAATNIWTIRMESKTTSAKSYRLRAADFHDLWVAAMAAAEIPVFHIQLCTMTAPLDLAVIQSGLGDELFGVKTSCDRYQSTYGVSLTSWADISRVGFDSFGLEVRLPHGVKRYDLVLCGFHKLRHAIQGKT